MRARVDCSSWDWSRDIATQRVQQMSHWGGGTKRVSLPSTTIRTAPEGQGQVERRQKLQRLSQAPDRIETLPEATVCGPCTQFKAQSPHFWMRL